LPPATGSPLGQALTSFDPEQGMPLLEKAVTLSRGSSVARLYRAQGRTMLAGQTGKGEDAELALVELRGIGLPDDAPLLVSTRLMARLWQALAYGKHNPGHGEVMKAAARDAEVLAGFRHYPYATLTRCYYFRVIEDDAGLLSEARRARVVDGVVSFATFELCVLVRHKKFAEAWAVAEEVRKREPSGAALTHCGFAAAMAGRREDALRAFADATREAKGGTSVTYPPMILMLLGPDHQVERRRANRALLDSQVIPAWRNGWYRDLVAYAADDKASPEELLHKAGPSRYNLCEAHLQIGLERLSGGNRAGAKEAFRQCLDTGVFSYNEYIWAWAFLRCIDDPEWLPWIPTNLEE
jgi:hypothetical protein